MTIFFIFTVVSLASFVLFVSGAQASPNYEINYQGKLTNASNVAVANDTYNIRFWLTTSPTIATTSAVWTEELTGTNKVQVTNGLFSIMLGSTTPLTGVDWSQTLYLGVEVGGTSTPLWDGEMSPRKILGAVPAAFEAENAQTLGGIATTSFLRSDQDDTASGLLTFTGGFVSTASSTITGLTTDIATTTTLVINGERFTNLLGTGLTNSGGTLTATLGTDITAGEIADGDHGFFSYASGIASLDTGGLTSADLLASLTDETGTGNAVFSTNPLLSGFRSFASSTIGDGTGAGGLTVLGNSTTTGVSYFGGNVGVGIASPAVGLHVYKNNGSDQASAYIQNASASGGAGSMLSLRTAGTNGVPYTQYYASGVGYWSTGYNTATGKFVITPTTDPQAAVIQNSFYMTTVGALGLGTSTPSSKLTIEQGMTGTGSLFQIASSSNGTATTTLFIVDRYGNVGIGTTSPNTLLGVQGTVTGANFIAYSTTSTTTLAGGLNVGEGGLVYDLQSGETYISSLISGTQTFDYDAGTVQWTDLPVWSAGLDTPQSYTASIGGNEMLTIYGLSSGASTTYNNMVGIGSSTPSRFLTVAGDSYFTNNITAASSTLGFASSTSLYTGTLGIGSDYITDLTGTGLSVTNGVLSASGDGLSNWLTQNGALTPSTTLGIRINASSTIGDGTGAGGLTVLGNSTTTGSVKISGSLAVAGITVTDFQNISMSSGDSIQWSGSATRIYGATSPSTLNFMTNSTNRFFIGGDGNIGVGTTTPASTFTVQGLGTTSPFVVASSTGSSMFKVNANGYVHVGSAGFRDGGSGQLSIIRSSDDTSGSLRVSTINTSGINSDSTGSSLKLGSASVSDAGQADAILAGYGAYSQTATPAIGFAAFRIYPTYNQSGSTAANTDLSILRVETAIGSGAQYLINAQTGGSLNAWATTTKFSVDRLGGGYFSDSLGIGSSSPSRKLTVNGDAIMANLTATGTATTTNLAITGILYDGAGIAGTNGHILQATGTGVQWVSTTTLGFGGGGGGVTSVDMAVPTGFTISGNPITNSGTLTLGYDTGYEGLKTASSTNWNAFFDTPSTRITAGSGLSWSGNTLSNTLNSNWLTQNGALTPSTTLGIRINASSTIGDGTGAGGLTILGNSTTTGDSYFGGNVGIGSSSPSATLSIQGSGTTNPFTVASSTGSSFLVLDTRGVLTFGTTTSANVFINGGYADAAAHRFLSDNIAIGGSSLLYASTTSVGTGNIAIGNSALRGDTSFTGGNNIAIGVSAGRSVTGVNAQNIFIGTSAGALTSSGYANTLIGYYAGYSNSTGTYNSMYGNQVGFNINGSENSLFGNNVGWGITSGSRNTFMGDSAGRGGALTGFTSQDNTLLGYRTGYNLATSTGNLFLGYQTASGTVTGDYNIALGYDVQLASTTGSNQLNIGNLIYGTNLGTGNTPSSGNVGIGTTTPTQKLSIAGNMHLTGSLYDSTYSAGTNGMVLQTTGTGVQWVATSTLGLGGTGTADGMSNWLTQNGALTPSTTLGIRINASSTIGDGTGTGGLTILGNSTTTGDVYFGGKVSLGSTTASSLAKLIMDGSMSSSGSTNAIAGEHYIFTFNPSANNTTQVGNRLVILNSPTGTATNTSVAQIIRTIDNSGISNLVRGLEISSSGGTNTYGVNTGLRSTGHTFGVQGITTGLAGGTSTPAALYGQNTGTTQGDILRLYTATMTSAPQMAQFYQEASAFTGTGLLMNFGAGGGTFTGNFLDLQVNENSRFTVTAGGTTTIGQLNQTSMMAGLQIGYGGLCVDNDGLCTATTTGRISAVSYTTGSSDLAENYYSDEALETGDIVRTKGKYSISMATDGADPIIGVVSTKPGMVLGEGEVKQEVGTAYPVGLSGRVPVKVSDQNGEVKVGDRIALSDVPGVGMKATGAQNETVVGIALEAFDGSFYRSQATIEDETRVVATGTPVCTTREVAGSRKIGGGLDSEGIVQGSEATTEATTEEVCEKPKVTIVPEAGSAQRVAVSDGEVRVGKVLLFIDLQRGFPLDTSSLALTSSSTDVRGDAQTFSMSSLTNMLTQFGIYVSDMFVQIKNLAVEALTIGSSEKPTGITLFDTETGLPYCLTIANGATKTTEGECGVVQATTEPDITGGDTGDAEVPPPPAPLPEGDTPPNEVVEPPTNEPAPVEENVSSETPLEIPPESISTESESAPSENTDPAVAESPSEPAPEPVI